MAVSTPNQYPVMLTDEQRRNFSNICRNGHAPAKKIRHAQLLLLSDHAREGGPLTRTQVGELLQMHPNTVDKIRKRFVLEGEAPALNRKPRETPPVAPILDGQAEAHLVAICCSDPPEGRACWTMQLLADELVNRRVVTQISAETVRRAPGAMLPALGKHVPFHAGLSTATDRRVELKVVMPVVWHVTKEHWCPVQPS